MEQYQMFRVYTDAVHSFTESDTSIDNLIKWLNERRIRFVKVIPLR